MSRNLVSNLIQAIRSGAYHTALKNLERQGYRTVTVLPAQKLDEIVSKAIELTLKEYGLPLDIEVVRGLSSDAKVAFVNLVKERDALRQTNEALERERENLSRNEELVRRELDQAQRLLTEQRELGAPTVPVEAAGFEKLVRDAALSQVEESLGRLGDGADPALVAELQGLAHRISAAAGRILGQASADGIEVARRRHDERVELLERRVRKLQSSLAETESMLKRLQEAKAVDPGLPSVYRSAQGISPSDDRFEQKRVLLAEIFKLNVELRRLIKEQDTAEALHETS
jgi:chaperonin cofactor prefoldin